jgi:hypothetical protein
MVKKTLTFVFAQVLAMGLLAALALLSVNFLSSSGVSEHVTRKFYICMVAYCEVPIAFICAFAAELLFRSKPFFIALVFVVFKTCVHIIYIPYLAMSWNFWIEFILSLASAMAGSFMAFYLLRRIEKKECMHPLWAGAAAVVVPVILWLVILRTAVQK